MEEGGPSELPPGAPVQPRAVQPSIQGWARRGDPTPFDRNRVNMGNETILGRVAKRERSPERDKDERTAVQRQLEDAGAPDPSCPICMDRPRDTTSHRGSKFAHSLCRECHDKVHAVPHGAEDEKRQKNVKCPECRQAMTQREPESTLYSKEVDKSQEFFPNASFHGSDDAGGGYLVNYTNLKEGETDMLELRHTDSDDKVTHTYTNISKEEGSHIQQMHTRGLELSADQARAQRAAGGADGPQFGSPLDITPQITNSSLHLFNSGDSYNLGNIGGSTFEMKKSESDEDWWYD
jgi:uncharacterized CHY-type Zn-finger protein